MVKAGKARYIGASSMYAWQFLKALHVAEQNGWTRFVSMQNHLNLLYREEEREMLPLCKEEKIGVIPWAPLAQGRLAREWSETTSRSANDPVAQRLYGATAESDRKVVERVAKVAEKHGVPRAQIALAWLLQKESITAPIIKLLVVLKMITANARAVQQAANNKALEGFDFRLELHKITAETLVISGKYDTLNTPEDGREIANLIPKLANGCWEQRNLTFDLSCLRG
ncbi:hypothetical protein PAAL109150_16685 [Paenibacillus alkaliterrae]